MCAHTRKILLLLCATGFSLPLHAGTALLFFGASRHWGCDQNRDSCDYREFNPGLGVEVAKQTDNWGKVFARLGRYRDSYGVQANFFSIGLRQDWALSRPEWRLGMGIMVGQSTGRHDRTIGLPFVYIAHTNLAVEFGLAPAQLSDQNYRAKYIGTLNIRWDLD